MTAPRPRKNRVVQPHPLNVGTKIYVPVLSALGACPLEPLNTTRWWPRHTYGAARTLRPWDWTPAAGLGRVGLRSVPQRKASGKAGGESGGPLRSQRMERRARWGKSRGEPVRGGGARLCRGVRVSLGLVNAYVLVRNRESVDVDMGTPNNAPKFAEVIRTADLSGDMVHHVIPTPYRPDHIGSMGEVLAEAQGRQPRRAPRTSRRSARCARAGPMAQGRAES